MKDIGKTFFKVFVEKEESEKLEYEKNDLVISKEESRSRIRYLLLITGLIEFFVLCGLMFIPAYITKETILIIKEDQKCKFAKDWKKHATFVFKCISFSPISKNDWGEIIVSQTWSNHQVSIWKKRSNFDIYEYILPIQRYKQIFADVCRSL